MSEKGSLSNYSQGSRGASYLKCSKGSKTHLVIQNRT